MLPPGECGLLLRFTASYGHLPAFLSKYETLRALTASYYGLVSRVPQLHPLSTALTVAQLPSCPANTGRTAATYSE